MSKLMNRFSISKNFSLHEFACKGGSDLVKIDAELVAKLQLLRDRLQRPIIINSGYRTPEHNKKVGGAPNSYHMQGKAVDIRVTGVTPERVAQVAEEVGFTGIGVYNTFTHVDIRPNKTRW